MTGVEDGYGWEVDGTDDGTDDDGCGAYDMLCGCPPPPTPTPEGMGLTPYIIRTGVDVCGACGGGV